MYVLELTKKRTFFWFCVDIELLDLLSIQTLYLLLCDQTIVYSGNPTALGISQLVFTNSTAAVCQELSATYCINQVAIRHLGQLNREILQYYYTNYSIVLVIVIS